MQKQINQPTIKHIESETVTSQRKEYYLVSPNSLITTEEFDEEHAGALQKKVMTDGVWLEPVLVLREERILLDGHHRLAVAKAIGLIKIPIKWVSMHDPNLKLCSWRKGVTVTIDDVIQVARSGRLFPKKTTRFTYSVGITNICVNLDLLR
jgi:uncharacterized protein (DUF1015 family)